MSVSPNRPINDDFPVWPMRAVYGSGCVFSDLATPCQIPGCEVCQSDDEKAVINVRATRAEQALQNLYSAFYVAWMSMGHGEASFSAIHAVRESREILER